MKKITCILSFLGLVLSTVGQNTEIKGHINKIKRSVSYICAEATLPIKEEAYQLANEILISEVNNWVESESKRLDVTTLFKKDPITKKIKHIVLEDINSCFETFEMRRGNCIRAFVFVKKSDIIPIYGQAHIILGDENNRVEIKSLDDLEKQREDANIQTSLCVPLTDNTVAQQIAQQNTISPIEKVIPEPDVVEPIQPEITPEENNVIMSVANLQPVQPIEILPQERAVVDNSHQSKTTISNESQPVQEIENVISEPNVYSEKETLRSMLMASNMGNMKPIFSKLKAENKIMYGKATGIDSVDPLAYLLLYDRSGIIVALLEPGDALRINLFNQKRVRLSDFKECGAYWFILDKY